MIRIRYLLRNFLSHVCITNASKKVPIFLKKRAKPFLLQALICKLIKRLKRDSYG